MKRLIDHFGKDLGSFTNVDTKRSFASASELITGYGGLSVGGGIYRIATSVIAKSLQESLAAAYPETSGPYAVFGYDWLGRVFAHRPVAAGAGSVLLFEVGAGEVLNIPVSLSDLHDTELIEYKNDCLAYEFFLQWQVANPEARITTEQCVGYKRLLILGGSDVLDNLEVTDLDVYVSICAQLRGQLRTK